MSARIESTAKRSHHKYVYNPETNKVISTTGRVYADLVKAGKTHFREAPKPRAHSRNYPGAPVAAKGNESVRLRSTRKSLRARIRAAERRYPRRQALHRHFESLERNEGRGPERIQAVRGWSADEPRTVGEREAMWKRSGQACFLAEPSSSKTGRARYRYPICPVGSTHPSRQGLEAALRRAEINVGKYRRTGQQKDEMFHQSIANKAKRMLHMSSSVKRGGHYGESCERHLRLLLGAGFGVLVGALVFGPIGALAVGLFGGLIGAIGDTAARDRCRAYLLSQYGAPQDAYLEPNQQVKAAARRYAAAHGY